MKIVVLDGYALNPGDLSWERLEGLGELTVWDRTPNELTVERIGDAELIITNKTPITREIFEACPSVRYVGVLATGYNVVDTDEAHRRGITVTNIPAYGTNAVAQHVFALLLEICCGIALHTDSVKAGEWERCADFTYRRSPLIELSGKTMGIIGYGRIGKRVAELATAFGMKVLAYSPSHKDGASLEDVLSCSDVISLHCPQKADNVGFINKNTVAKMKDGVILINTARGGLVNEAELAEALECGKVYAYAADVLSCEPPRDGSPLIGAKNCYITPHIAWAPREARVRLMNIAADNVEAFIGGKPINTV